MRKLAKLKAESRFSVADGADSRQMPTVRLGGRRPKRRKAWAGCGVVAAPPGAAVGRRGAALVPEPQPEPPRRPAPAACWLSGRRPERQRHRQQKQEAARGAAASEAAPRTLPSGGPCSRWGEQAQPNTDWRFSQTQRPGTSGSQNGEEGGAWPNNQFDTEMLQAMILASANEAADGNSTLGGGTGTMGLSARYGPQFTLQHVPDYRQNVYIPGSTATLTNAAGKRDAKSAGSSGGNKKKSGKKEKK
ncbi:protocadherin gamma-A8-like isoform X13 [Chroicocephalus ridibundus]|uniref:protocadherin gamma-A8-like isoform X13 n=1 Tax=Chroicocephalus ridibundus TaxID=1192867 RepID=UPI002FDF06EA